MRVRWLINPLVAMLLVFVMVQIAAPFGRAQETNAAAQPVARVIVKLQSAGDEGALMRGIREQVAHPERLQYLHAVSNDAHVLSVVAPATRESVPALLDELRATGLFEYVELDRMLTIHH